MSQISNLRILVLLPNKLLILKLSILHTLIPFIPHNLLTTLLIHIPQQIRSLLLSQNLLKIILQTQLILQHLILHLLLQQLLLNLILLLHQLNLILTIIIQPLTLISLLLPLFLIILPPIFLIILLFPIILLILIQILIRMQFILFLRLNCVHTRNLPRINHLHNFIKICIAISLSDILLQRPPLIFHNHNIFITLILLIINMIFHFIFIFLLLHILLILLLLISLLGLLNALKHIHPINLAFQIRVHLFPQQRLLLPLFFLNLKFVVRKLLLILIQLLIVQIRRVAALPLLQLLNVLRRNNLLNPLDNKHRRETPELIALNLPLHKPVLQNGVMRLINLPKHVVDIPQNISVYLLIFYFYPSRTTSCPGPKPATNSSPKSQ